MLRWLPRGGSRWVGYDDDLRQVAFVAEVVTAGGEHRYWMGWRSDGTHEGISTGEYATAHEAMTAVDNVS
jgi:hypothetical protein